MVKELEGIIEYATKEYDKRVANEILEQLGKGVNVDDIFVITDEMWCKDFQVVTRNDATDPNNWPIGNGGYDRIPSPDEDFESAEKWIQDSFEEYCEATETENS